MKKQLLTLLAVTTLGLVSWATAQSGSSAPFDVKKSQMELEVMRGILNTTLGFVANDLRGRQAGTATGHREAFLANSWWSSNVSAFYLYGQGASFLIPVSGLRASTGHFMGDVEPFTVAMAEAEANLEASAATLDALAHEGALAGTGVGVGRGVGGGVSGGVVGGIPGGVSGGVVGGVPGGIPTPPPAQEPPALAAPPAPPAPPVPPKAAKAPTNHQEMRKRLAEAQDRVKRRREESELEHQKLMEAVSQAKVYLIEALANHGDSLTTVKPNEYINLIITGEDGNVFFPGTDESQARRDVISVQKSVITDYKAGRLTLDAFKQKVLQYEE